MSSFLNFACGASHSRSLRGILRLAVLNPCAARGKALRPVASLGLKQNSCFKILKQVLKISSALAFFGRNFRFKICTRFKFKDGSQKRGCLASPIAAIAAVPASPSATLPTTLPALAALSVSTRAQASALMQTQASTPLSAQIQARAKFKSVEFKSAIFKFAAFQSTLAKRAIFKFTKFTIFSLAALKFKNGPFAQRRALV